MQQEAHILHLKAHVPWWLPWVTFVTGLAIGTGISFGIFAFMMAHAAGT